MINKKLSLLSGIVCVALLIPMPVKAIEIGKWLKKSPGYTPADGLKYWAETVKEELWLFFSSSQDQKAHRYLEQAEERIAEVEAMATRKQFKKIDANLMKYQRQLEKAQLIADKINQTSAPTHGFNEKLAGSVLRQQAVLHEINNRSELPQKQRETIQFILGVTQNIYEEVNSRISEPTKSQITQDVEADIPNLKDNLPTQLKSKVPGL